MQRILFICLFIFSLNPMFVNKHPWEKAHKLFGVVRNYGAQIPQK
ncbi:hypothetical protein PORCRE_1969 [Porphyromonas crevioricanis JCM 15906]|uniref:Uncharacterized protein n=1 Tax=Porphyromonas crevioricanis JCM 15906 TaxID=1305617 RepID=T1DTK8_9PORP|nr:hypothetical protein PORCRE_1969 [Porphyromonas crevioricanis JCM 15906]GAD06781.1 hypothetical protein PORCAN_389 [Porphyromonas crevioricanis JCM 13913]